MRLVGRLLNIMITSLQEFENRLLHPETDLRHLSAEQQFERIIAKASDLTEAVVSPADLLERLKVSKATNRPLKIKFGIDPTGPDIHIGHAVSLLNLRLFQRMGHKVVLVIGDFTGMVGDPSGRMDARTALSEEDVRQNMTTYEEQAAKIIDLKDPSIERHYNSTWMHQLTMREWMGIIKKISATSLLQREDFRTRIKTGQGLSMAELEYALFMGYDSVVLNPDVELGGVDQYLNMHVCRQMMTNAGQRPEVIISYNLLAGTTGERDTQGRYVKMSKSSGNYIPVMADPSNMYGAVLSIPDEVMWVWYRELTESTPGEVGELKALVESGQLHPKQAKQLLARVIVGTFNGFDRDIIEAAENDFNEKFGKGATLVPDSTQVVRLEPDKNFMETLVQLTGKTKNEIRRLVQQQGIRLLHGDEYVPLTVEQLTLPSANLKGSVLKVGKRFYYKFEM
jgi:tyrosyl-tRNA synthetase